jgi:rhamnosyltransferase
MEIKERMEKNNIKRVLVYFFYDKDGIVDRYVPHILEDMKNNVSEVLIVVNGFLTDASRKIFEMITANILVRENNGFDVWAYKAGLEYFGWDKLAEFDETILMNYTFFGPLYPFSEMFEAMKKRNVDFWGITKHHKVNFDVFHTCEYGYIPEHIQSNFLVIRKNMMKSQEYQSFWENMPKINSYGESVGKYEVIFTKKFKEKGFKADVYINTDDLEGYTRYPLMMMADELIINRRCPIFKAKSFSQNYYDIIGDCVGYCTVDALEYIQRHLTYDTDMIWEHILRTANMSDIKNLLHLNYILPKGYIMPHVKRKALRIALMVHIYYPELINYCLNYAQSMPKGSDLIVTVPSEKQKKLVALEIAKRELDNIKFKAVEIVVVQNIGRDVSALLVGCKPYIYDYDYVCFIHDKKAKQVEPYCNGVSFSYKCFENNLGSAEYVENIISTFENDPRMGLLTPPPPNHGSLYHIIGNEWGSNFGNVKMLAEKLKIRCDIDNLKAPIAPLGTMFWFRPKALKVLFDYDWKYEDFPSEPNHWDGTLLHALERIYAFAVQHEGYYSAWIMTDKFARVELTNLYFMLRTINLALFQIYWTTSLVDMVENIKNRATSGAAVPDDKSVHKRSFRTIIKIKLKKILPNIVWRFLKKNYYKVMGSMLNSIPIKYIKNNTDTEFNTNGIYIDSCDNILQQEAWKINLSDNIETYKIIGWAFDIEQKRPLRRLYVKTEKILLKCNYGIKRITVADFFKNQDLLYTGFDIEIPAEYIKDRKEIGFIMVGTNGKYRYETVVYTLEGGNQELEEK